jgi:hypothetical protein
MLALYALSAFLSLASFAAGQSVCGAPIDYNTKCTRVSCKEGPFGCYTDQAAEWTCAMCNHDVAAEVNKAPANNGQKVPTGETPTLPAGCHGLFRDEKSFVVIDDSTRVVLYYAPKAQWSALLAAADKSKAVDVAKRSPMGPIDTSALVAVYVAMSVCAVVAAPFIAMYMGVATGVNWAASKITGDKDTQVLPSVKNPFEINLFRA